MGRGLFQTGYGLLAAGAVGAALFRLDSLVGAFVVLILLWMSADFGSRVHEEIERGDRPGVESHWGGLGGGLGGWRLTPSLTYLLIALLFALVAVVAAAQLGFVKIPATVAKAVQDAPSGQQPDPPSTAGAASEPEPETPPVTPPPRTQGSGGSAAGNQPPPP